MTTKYYKKKYLLGKDSFGKNIYPGDIVELYCPSETKKTWTSEIYWSMLMGAWVEVQPSHNFFTNKQRTLYDLINQEDHFVWEGDYDECGEEKLKSYKGYCKRITPFNKKIK